MIKAISSWVDNSGYKYKFDTFNKKKKIPEWDNLILPLPDSSLGKLTSSEINTKLND